MDSEPSDIAVDEVAPDRNWFRWYAPVVAAMLVVLVADQATKSWAVDRLNPLSGGGPIELFWTFDFRLAYNTGMAFSAGSGRGPLIGAVALCVVAGLLWAAREITSAWARVVVGIVVGGALGNVVDRLFRGPAPGGEDGFMKGAVIDFIYVDWWPTFNVADAAVVVGGILLALMVWRMEDAEA